MDLELRHLRLVSALAEEGNMTRAAERLHLTQSALSHQLKDAEESLGAQLFTRANKKMELTPAGERLVESARSILFELQRTAEEIKRGQDEERGKIRISTECYTCYHWLPEFLREFGEEYPKVDVEIVIEATRRPLPALLDGRLDVAIVCEPIKSKRIEYRHLFEDQLMAIACPAHPMASRPYASAKDFEGQHVIIYSITDKDSTLIQQVLIPGGVTPARISRVELTEAIVEMVKANLGVSVLASWAAAPHVKAGTLVAIPLLKGGLKRRWSAAVLKSPRQPPYVTHFLELLEKRSWRGVANRAKR